MSSRAEVEARCVRRSASRGVVVVVEGGSDEEEEVVVELSLVVEVVGEGIFFGFLGSG